MQVLDKVIDEIERALREWDMTVSGRRRGGANGRSRTVSTAPFVCNNIVSRARWSADVSYRLDPSTYSTPLLQNSSEATITAWPLSCEVLRFGP